MRDGSGLRFRGLALRLPDELPGPTDPVEAEALIELLGPVIFVHHDEDVASAGLARGLDRPEDDGASHASAAELLKRIHVLDLSVRTVDVELAVAGELAAQPDGEEPRSDHSLVLPMLLREQSDDLVGSELGLAPIHLMDEVLVAVAREGWRVPLARRVVPNQHPPVLIAGLAENPIDLSEERLHWHAI